jgi:cytochrome b involved in lipid metabolism
MKSTKILFGLGLFVAFAFLTALFTAYLLNLQNPQTSINPQININPSNIGNANGSINQSQFSLTGQEVAKHNQASDCWMIVNNKVYDLTPLVYSHSGGSSTIIPDCGKDGSKGFNTKYGQGYHSSNANSILSSFYIGELGQQITAAELQNKTDAIANTSVPRSGEDD